MKKILAAALVLALLAVAVVAMAEVNLEFIKTGSGAMSETLAPVGGWKIKQVTLHLSAVGGSSEDFTCTMDANAGAAYDAVLESRDMAAVADFNASSVPWYGRDGDKVLFTWTNSNSKTWGLRVVWEPVGK